MQWTTQHAHQLENEQSKWPRWNRLKVNWVARRNYCIHIDTSIYFKLQGRHLPPGKENRRTTDGTQKIWQNGQRKLCPLSILSLPSKILESCLNNLIVNHVLNFNCLVRENKWAYHKGYFTELLLVHDKQEIRKDTSRKLLIVEIMTSCLTSFNINSVYTAPHKTDWQVTLHRNNSTWF